MDELRFEWDDNKATLNQTKHSVSFVEASTVLFDPCALVIEDPDHSMGEERFIILGHSRQLRLLVVAHCYRQTNGIIRIISARKATKTEAKTYQRSGRYGR